MASIGLVVLMSAGLAAAETKPDIRNLNVSALKISATPIANFGRAGAKTDTGKLEWRGGLLLQATHANFGGWSGLVVEPDGRRFLSVSDSGIWMSGEITYNGSAPAGIKDARIGPLLTLDGKTLDRRKDRDAEAVALVSGDLQRGSILVSFEGNARIARYDFGASGVSATRGFLSLPDKAKKMRRNSGLEAMTLMKGGPYKGAVIAFSERMRDAKRNHVGWIWAEGVTEQMSLKDIGGFDVVDVASLEDGGIIVLERRFRWLEGLRIRLRKVAAGDLTTAGPITGETLLEADLTSEIDNMEGLALSRDAKGQMILTLISDDNFNQYLQRTLLLQFALPGDVAEPDAGPKTAKARP
ncbi:MAG: esterase-like activity of phytase family protein [Hyphomicrobium sp.]